MTQTKEQRLATIHAEALAEFDKVQSAMRDERMQCLMDRRFYSIAGAQWEGSLGDQFENKPKFEMNKVHLSVMRIITEYRNNRISVRFTPKDGQPDEMADVCAGLFRADESDSTAEEAYDNAFEEAAAGGFGAFRLKACYEDEDDDENDRQRVRFEPIPDADSSVFFDLNAKRQDKADAVKCWVVVAMDRAAYEAEYGDDMADWSKSIHGVQFDWCTPDVVYVAEYFRVEEKTELVRYFRDLDDTDMAVPQQELDDEPDKLAMLQATGFREVRQKRKKVRKVRKYIMNGARVISDEGYIAGKHIPIIPVYGKRWFVDNIERCMGHVRPAKDAQRLKNMQVSLMATLSAQSPREKPIFTPEQMQGHAMQWADDPIKDYPFLLINAMRDADGQLLPSGPVAYTKPPSVPQTMAALLQITEQDMKDLLGNADALDQVQPQTSGIAVELVQNRLDMQTAIYMSNFARALKWCGVVWLSMMRDIVVEDRRRMKTVDGQGEVASVLVNDPGYNPETGEEVTQNDLREATFDVEVEVGPTSSSRRASTVRTLVGMMQMAKDPETLTILMAMAIMNMEGEGLRDLRDFYRRKLVQMGAVKPTEEEMQMLAQQQANQQPGPQEQYLLAAAQEAAAGAEERKAKTVQTLADANLKEAQRQKVNVEAGVAVNGAQIASVEAMHNLLQPAESPQSPPMP